MTLGAGYDLAAGTTQLEAMPWASDGARMYSLGDDSVSPLADMPPPSPGAPLPVVLANDLDLCVCYIISERSPEWDRRTARLVGPNTKDLPIALVYFPLVLCHQFGPPNDEALDGHPLWRRGLEPYSTFEVAQSSWVKQLCEMNRVHPMHDDSRFEKYRHFIFTFHDSTLECLATEYAVSVHRGSISDILPLMVKRLER